MPRHVAASPELSPVLNSDNPAELFELPEIWHPDFKDEIEVQSDDEERMMCRSEAALQRVSSLGAIPALSTGRRRLGVDPLSLDLQTSSAESRPERPWWTALYHQQVVATVTARNITQQFPETGKRRWHVFKHLILQQGAFLAFVLLSANDTILKAQSKRRIDGPHTPRDFPYSFSALLLLASFISVATGSALGFYFHGFNGLKRCWNPKLLLRMTPISMMFQFATILKFVSLKYLPPDMVGLLSQMNLILMAVAMRVVIGKRFAFSQWIALILTALTMLQYLTIRDGRHKAHFNDSFLQVSPNVMEGFLVLVAMCVVETLASVYAEKYFKERRCKGTPPEPFYIQKVHVDVSGMLFSAVWCYVLEPFYLKDLNWSCKPHRCRQVIEHGLLSGWDEMTWIVLGVVVTKMWLSGLVAKVLDTVVKQLGSCAAMVLTYLEVIWLFPDKNHIDFDTSVALAVVVMAIASFAVSTRDSEKIQRLSTTPSPRAHDAWAAQYAARRG